MKMLAGARIHGLRTSNSPAQKSEHEDEHEHEDDFDAPSALPRNRWDPRFKMCR